MLEKLNKVNWSDLEMASGSASDIPQLIGDLSDDDPDIAEEALLSLASNICEQGIVFNATPAVVPFLIAVLEEASPQDPAGIIDLLAQIAESRDVQIVQLPPRHEYTFMPQKGEEYAKDDEEMAWSEEAYSAVGKGLPVYRQLLDNDDPTVRTSAGALLELYPAEARENAIAIRKALDIEDDIPAMTDLMLSLRDVLSSAVMPDSERAEYLEFYRDIFDNETDDVIRLAAAISTLRLNVGAANKDMIDVMVDAVIDPQKYSTYVVDTLENPVHEALATLNNTAHPDKRALMVNALEETNDPANARNLATALLANTFGREPLETLTKSGVVEAPPLRETLTDEQAEVINAILNSDAFWVIPASILSVFGLPVSRGDLLSYLENPNAYIASLAE